MAKKKAPAKPPDLFASRRARLEDALVEDAAGRQAVAVVFSGEETGLDVFQADPDFRYLTGVNAPGAALVFHVAPSSRTQILLLPAPDPASERWTGKVLSAGWLDSEAEPDALRREAMEQTGMKLVGATHQLAEVLQRPMRVAEVAFIPFPADALKGPIGANQLYAEDLRRRYPSLEIRNLAPRVAGLRRVKSPEEVALMRRAAAITDRALDVLLAHLKPGMTEYQAQALVEYVFRAEGAEGVAFSTILGSGPWACILHYNRNRRTMASGDLSVCDMGARVGGYCADITRTYPVSGKFTKRQRAVYQTVLDAQAAAIGSVRPGALIRDVHAAATAVIEKAGFGRFFFHGTSHHLGLEAHDPGPVDLPLEPGCVITVEPGVYIASEALGVRIEDDILVTAEGCEVLTRTTKDPREIERVLAKPRRTVRL